MALSKVKKNVKTKKTEDELCMRRRSRSDVGFGSFHESGKMSGDTRGEKGPGAKAKRKDGMNVKCEWRALGEAEKIERREAIGREKMFAKSCDRGSAWAELDAQSEPENWGEGSRYEGRRRGEMPIERRKRVQVGEKVPCNELMVTGPRGESEKKRWEECDIRLACMRRRRKNGTA
ncbi:hypothetical protein PLICRDRAFT_33134 [Plicaturopsis crispa FD-325 SS-3]|uniref:Uncharacterized protein n=1 Tax=Plicaturopsis crispa FD-325 SS-3 TaxID=944288 RepID=A0A0C9SPV1_PLICR|nr:hypothetical protein PLICRDRAFT_33134 [Plicaturopsis crispa FD-325 SS-3]